MVTWYHCTLKLPVGMLKYHYVSKYTTALDMTKTRNGLQNGLANGLEGTCLKCSFGHKNPLYNEHTA